MISDDENRDVYRANGKLAGNFVELPSDTPLSVGSVPHFIRKPKKTGEMDLQQIALTCNDGEAAYLFIPATSCWYNIASSSGGKIRVEEKVNAAAFVWEHAFNRYDLLWMGHILEEPYCLYHTHPFEADDELTERLRHDFSDIAANVRSITGSTASQESYVRDVLVEAHFALANAVPNFVDLETQVKRHMSLKNGFMGSFLPGIHYVVSRYGVVSSQIITNKLGELMRKIDQYKERIHQKSEITFPSGPDDRAFILRGKINDLNRLFKDMVKFEFYTLEAEES